MHRFRFRSAVAIAAVGALCFAVTPASADGGAKCKIKITKLTAGGAKGKVTSRKDRCEGGGRRVQFFRLDGFISVKIQKTHTNKKGKWRIKRDLEPGRYFAKVDSSRGCRYDNSKNERLRG